MKNKSNFYLLNMILIFILMVVIFGDFLIMKETPELVSGMKRSMDTVQQEEYDIVSEELNNVESDDDMKWYSLLSVEEIRAEYIGKEYEEKPAIENYSYYKLICKIYNGGNLYEYSSYLPLYLKGDYYNDIYGEEEDEQYDVDIEYYANDIIPPCTSTDVTKIIQVKDGCTEIQAEFYETLDKEKPILYTVKLNGTDGE